MKSAIEWLGSYQRLRKFGDVGRMLSEEASIFYKEKKKAENLLDFCVRKAIEQLMDTGEK